MGKSNIDLNLGDNRRELGRIRRTLTALLENEEFLRLMKDEIVPFIEQEIAVRYYFQTAGVEIRIRYDDTLRQALSSERIQQY